jgi:hypothetical protein
MVQLRAIMGFAACLAGCAGTSGREWLSAPIEERTTPRFTEVGNISEATESRPRLSHTVTLGETYGAPATPPSTSSAPSGATVQVNVQTQVPVTVNHYGGYGYGGYGYGYGAGYPAGTLAPGRATRSAAASQKVGADFPPIVSYGPRAMK